MEYRLYLTTARGKILAAHEAICPSDAEALAMAQCLFRNNSFEVWQGARKIAVPATGQNTAASGAPGDRS